MSQNLLPIMGKLHICNVRAFVQTGRPFHESSMEALAEAVERCVGGQHAVRETKIIQGKGTSQLDSYRST